MSSTRYVSICVIFLSLACTGPKYYSKKIIQPVLDTPAPDSIQQERDNIFSLLTYAIVYQDWQPDSIPRESRRGYNIGALLVDTNNEPVQYGLNSISGTNNATQHGEIRAIMSYLEKTRRFNLEGFTIYTSLEPCIMCAGMITMTAMKKVVFGQHDVEYSKAFERLAIDTRPIGGFPPYPRQVAASSCPLDFCRQLDDAYHEYLQSDDEKILAKFLTTPRANTIFNAATEAFLSFSVQHAVNRPIYENALRFYSTLKK